MENMQTVIAMRAIPGSGKSTLAKQLVEKARSNGQTAVICSADDFFMVGGEYKFDFTKISEAHKTCFRKFMKAIADNVNLIIIDNTNLSAQEISPYKMYAEVHDYKFTINQVFVEKEIAFKRQSHGVPQQSHDRMHDFFNKEQLPPYWENVESFESKTNDGKPSFEKKSSSLEKLLKLAKYFELKLKYNKV